MKAVLVTKEGVSVQDVETPKPKIMKFLLKFMHVD
jgi:hypothetical protein